MRTGQMGARAGGQAVQARTTRAVMLPRLPICGLSMSMSRLGSRMYDCSYRRGFSASSGPAARGEASGQGAALLVAMAAAHWLLGALSRQRAGRAGGRAMGLTAEPGLFIAACRRLVAGARLQRAGRGKAHARPLRVGDGPCATGQRWGERANSTQPSGHEQPGAPAPSRRHCLRAAHPRRACAHPAGRCHAGPAWTAGAARSCPPSRSVAGR